VKRRSVYLDDETFEELREVAHRERVTISEIIRRYLHRGGPVPTDRHRVTDRKPTKGVFG